MTDFRDAHRRSPHIRFGLPLAVTLAASGLVLAVTSGLAQQAIARISVHPGESFAVGHVGACSFTHVVVSDDSVRGACLNGTPEPTMVMPGGTATPAPSPTAVATSTSVPATRVPTIGPSSPTATVAPPPPTQVPVTPQPTVLPTPAPTLAPVQPVAGLPCPDWVHAQFVTAGPDGKMYPTWHPPVDPQSGCLFGHEHGADPRTSKANSSMPAFGYAAAVMNMTESHQGFKVFSMNSGDTVESNIPSKIADEDARIVFHQGTSGVGRYSQQFHSIQYDYIDRSGSGREAHLTGMANTGLTENDGDTCDLPRKGAKDFSTVGCPDPYEIWPTGLQITAFGAPFPLEPMQNIVALGSSIAAFDPITTRNPLDLSQLLYTQNVQGPQSTVDPTSPAAFYQGCRREFYSGRDYFGNAGGATVYWTDAMGNVSAGNVQDPAHPIKQLVSATSGSKDPIYKLRTDYCGNGIHSPN